jgi:hypothetical protein
MWENPLLFYLDPAVSADFDPNGKAAESFLEPFQDFRPVWQAALLPGV